jgi:hypothetical protein
MPALAQRVRRRVVATHGPEIEARLTDTFGDAGWRCEAWETCRQDASGTLVRDGTQVWRNPVSTADEFSPKVASENSPLGCGG